MSFVTMTIGMKLTCYYIIVFVSMTLVLSVTCCHDTVRLSVTCSCVLVMTVTCCYAYSVNSDWIFYCYTIWHQLKIPEPDLAYCWLVSLSYWSGNTGTPSVSTKKSNSKFITPNVRAIMSNNSINKLIGILPIHSGMWSCEDTRW